MGEKVTSREIVAVLGRWKTHTEWEQVGTLIEMNELFDDAGLVQDGPALARAWERWDEANADSLWGATIKKDRRAELPPWKARRRQFDPHWGVPDVEPPGAQPWAARTPERRAWCIRNGQAQRWWHNQNVGSLPFQDEALAASVGATAAELDAEGVSDIACDVVFDALSESKSGIVDKALIDARRASCTTRDGAFDADSFAAHLGAARKNVAVSLAIFPGSMNLIFFVAYLQADGVQATLDAWAQMLSTVAANVELWRGMVGM